MSSESEGVASKEELVKFFEHVFQVWMSAEEEDTHVVIPPRELTAINMWFENTYETGFDRGVDDILPADVIKIRSHLDTQRFSFSELCLMGALAQQIHKAGYQGAPEQLCVPKYMLDALLHIMLFPAFARMAGDWFSIQDYKL